MDDIGMDSDYRSGYEPQPCAHQDDIWDCSICGREMYGGGSHRTCHHGYYRGECPTCYPDRPERVSDW